MQRIFATALARRFAVVIVGAALAWLGMSDARAQASLDEGQAYVDCVSRTQAYVAGAPVPGWRVFIGCNHTNGLGVTNNSAWFGWISQKSFQDGPYSDTTVITVSIAAGKTCASRADYNGAYPYQQFGRPRNGSFTCFNGCTEVWRDGGDGTFVGSYGVSIVCMTPENDADCQSLGGPDYYYNAHLKSCEPQLPDHCEDGKEKDAYGNCVESTCPAGMKQQADGTCANEKNECPAGEVKAPSGACLPGDGQCAAGEARGKDGTCKRDADGDGQPDEGEDDGTTQETFSGGDNCSSPPSCSGSPIMCGQARIQWRIDCNTRKNRNVSGGHCAAEPVCTGEKCDAVEYNQLLMQWRSACALEKIAQGGGTGDGSQPEWTKVGGMGQDPGAGAVEGDTPRLHEHAFTTDDLDQSGFGGGGTCPGFATASGSGVSSGFISTLASPPPLWCNYIGFIRAVLVLVGAVAAVFILAKGVG